MPWLFAITLLELGGVGRREVRRGHAGQVLLGDLRGVQDRLPQRRAFDLLFVLVAADPVGLVLAHPGRVEPHAAGVEPGDEVDPAGGAGQPAQGIRTEAGLDDLVLRTAVPEGEPDLLEHDAFGPLVAPRRPW